jgi:hypothetical protein
VHIFIFVVAAVHVTMGIIMILLASWRLHLWRRMCGDDDEHAQGWAAAWHLLCWVARGDVQ